MTGLIIEDHNRQLDLLAEELSKRGLTILRAGSVREAQHALARPIDFVVCDLCLERSPNPDAGLNLIGSARRSAPKILIMAWSAHLLLETKALSAGANLFLEKHIGASLTQSIKMTALEVEIALLRHFGDLESTPFTEIARQAIRWIATWVSVPGLAALYTTEWLIAGGVRLPHTIPFFAALLPLLCWMLFLATIVPAVGRHHPVIANWKLFLLFLKGRKALLLASLSAIVGGAFYDLVKEAVLLPFLQTLGILVH